MHGMCLHRCAPAAAARVCTHPFPRHHPWLHRRPLANRLSPVAASDFESADAESSPSSSSGGGSSSASASPSSYTPSAFSISNNGGPAPTPSPTPSSTPTPPPSVTAQATTSDAASSTTAAPYTSLRGSGSGSSVPNLRKVQYLKSRLVSAVASLDRGLAATAREAQEVDDLCSQLERLAGGIDLKPRIPGDIDYANGTVDEPSGAPEKLAGMWRLVYTSGFNTGSLGGRRPGPPAALVPTTLGQVYQRIDAATGKLDNVVELLFTPSLPDLGAALLGTAQPRRDTPALRLTLRHDYELQGSGTVQIVYVDTFAELVGSSLFRNLPRLEVPSLPEPLRPPKFLRSAKFEVTYLDDGMRVTRGDRGELRVYLRERDDVMALETPAAAMWGSEEEDD